ncbi:MAG: nucleoside phosphorylase [Deltaproteobacteria bacterium]|nr:nucleoside phosphorylase [Deltaproteobacteria bacterium]MCL5792219.1 nucleoside phosphorylase [Deltaproteobacteria bacterium]
MKKLYHLRIKTKDMSKLVIMPGDPHRSRYIADVFLKNVKIINTNRGIDAYTGTYKNKTISVVTSGMGAPSAAIVVEELKRLGVDTIIRTGTCGGVNKCIKPGDMIIPTGAGSMIGFKRVYGIHEVPSSPDFYVMQKLVSNADKKGISFHTGPIVTSDSFFSEKSHAKMLESKGILAMEMECSALFALGIVRHIKTGAVLLSTGNINYAEQVMDTPRIRRSMDIMIEIALDSIVA